MEWEIIISLYDWELLVLILSLLLGSAAFTVHIRTRTIQDDRFYCYQHTLNVSKNININWLFPSIVHPTRIYLLCKKFVIYRDEIVKVGHFSNI